MGPNTIKILGWAGSAIAYLFSFVFALRFVFWRAFIGNWSWAQALNSTLFSPIWIPLHLMGSTLLFLSLYRLGDYYNDDGIKRDSFWWFIWWAIFGEAVNGIIMFSVRVTSDTSAIVPVAIIISFMVAMLLLMISAVYLKDAYAALAARTGVGLFNIAAKLYLIGSLSVAFSWFYVPIAAFVGALIVWTSWAISALAFLSIKPGIAAP